MIASRRRPGSRPPSSPPVTKWAADHSIHLVASRPPLLRLHGELEPLTPSPLPADKLRAMLEEIAGPGLSATYRQSGDADFAYALPGVARFRVNLFPQQKGPAAVLRIIPDKVLTLEELGAPAVLSRLADLQQGLVLVTGPTGSGKSTTMAAIVDAINTRRARHVITIEDPLEFVHPRKKSVFSQREVGQHDPRRSSRRRARSRRVPAAGRALTLPVAPGPGPAFEIQLECCSEARAGRSASAAFPLPASPHRCSYMDRYGPLKGVPGAG